VPQTASVRSFKERYYFSCCVTGDMSHHWTAGLLFVHIAAKRRSKKMIPIGLIRNTDCFGETALPLRAGNLRNGGGD
jgi:hypothetical protein